VDAEECLRFQPIPVRRFKIVDGELQRWTHLALHDLDSLKALESSLFDRHKDRHIACPTM